MFIYISNIQNKAEAEQAIACRAAGIAVRLGYKKSALAAEQTRDWLEQLPLPIFKIGEFYDEAYYDVEEMASFCHLDVITLGLQDQLSHYSRYSGRILISLASGKLTGLGEEKLQQIKEIANGIILPVGMDGEALWQQKQLLSDWGKPIFLTGVGSALLATGKKLAQQENHRLASLVYGWYLPYEEWAATGFAGNRQDRVL